MSTPFARRGYTELPAAPSPTVLDPDGWISVVVPLARTNLITNPSFETNTTDWSAQGTGAVIARTTSKQRYGAYSLQVTTGTTANGGTRYAGTLNLTASTVYAISAWVYAPTGKQFRLSVSTTGGAFLATKTFTGVGRWQWVTLIYQESASTARYVYVTNVLAQSSTLYLDGVQVEACSDGYYEATTYIDGSQAGLVPNEFPAAYQWTGTPHASPSSRTAQTRAGGRLVNIQKTCSFLITAIVGLGMIPPNNVSVSYAQADGAAFQYTQLPPRSFSIGGVFDTTTLGEASAARGKLADALNSKATRESQPIKLIYHPTDCGKPIGDRLELVCSYTGGLEGSVDLIRSGAVLSFTMWMPYIQAYDAGASLGVKSIFDIPDYGNLARRKPDGTWINMDHGVSGSVYSIARAPDNTIYVGGLFATAGSGALTVNNIARYLPESNTYQALGGGTVGVNNQVNSVAVAPNGILYAAGDFTAAGGGAASHIAQYDPGSNTWSALGSGISGGAATVNAMAVAPDGKLYVGGGFTTAGGGAAANIAVWNPDTTTWAAIGTGLNNSVITITVVNTTTILLGGDFTDIGGGPGGTYNRIIQRNIGTSTWSALGTGMDNSVFKIQMGWDGYLYAVGTFTTAGGSAAASRARWNGTAWTALGTPTGTLTHSLSVGANGVVYVVGYGSGATSYDIQEWANGTWRSLQFYMGIANFPPFLAAPSGDIYVAGGISAKFPATTVVTNLGSTDAYPVITVTGPTVGSGKLQGLFNYTTGAVVELDLTIRPGEVATLSFQPGAVSFTTTFQGNVASTILPGSDVSVFRLLPGANTIGVYCTDASMTATLKLTQAHESLDKAIWR